MPTDMDAYYLTIAVALERGEVDLPRAIQKMSEDAVFDRAEAEDIKILLRGSLMAERAFGADSAFYMAIVAREVALRLRDPDIDYGLSIGVANAIACCDYVLSLYSRKADQLPAAIEYLMHMRPVLTQVEDWKGDIEALDQIGTLELQLDQYEASAAHFEEGIRTVQKLKDYEAVVEGNSTQDMVRTDSENTYDFGPLPVVNMGNRNLLLSYLEERAALSLLQAGHDTRALALSTDSATLWSTQLRETCPFAGLDALRTHFLILAVNERFDDAVPVGKELLALATTFEDDDLQSRTAALLSECYSKLGDDSLAKKYSSLSLQKGTGYGDDASKEEAELRAQFFLTIPRWFPLRML
jgi:hypothetical protein